MLPGPSWLRQMGIKQYDGVTKTSGRSALDVVPARPIVELHFFDQGDAGLKGLGLPSHLEPADQVSAGFSLPGLLCRVQQTPAGRPFAALKSPPVDLCEQHMSEVVVRRPGTLGCRCPAIWAWLPVGLRYLWRSCRSVSYDQVQGRGLR